MLKSGILMEKHIVPLGAQCFTNTISSCGIPVFDMYRVRISLGMKYLQHLSAQMIHNISMYIYIYIYTDRFGSSLFSQVKHGKVSL